MDISALNNLRNRLKAAWSAPGELPRPQILLREDTAEPPIEQIGRTIASEMGLRFIDLDLAGGLSASHLTHLARPGPRLVVVRNMGLTPPDRLEAQVRAGTRTLILIEIRQPADASLGAADDLSSAA